MRAREAPHVERLGHWREDRLNLLGQDGAKPALVELLEPPLGDRTPNPLRCFGAEVGRDQRFLDVVERRRIERDLGREPADILAKPIRGFLEAACQAVEPTHAAIPIS